MGNWDQGLRNNPHKKGYRSSKEPVKALLSWFVIFSQTRQKAKASFRRAAAKRVVMVAVASKGASLGGSVQTDVKRT